MDVPNAANNFICIYADQMAELRDTPTIHYFLYPPLEIDKNTLIEFWRREFGNVDLKKKRGNR